MWKNIIMIAVSFVSFLASLILFCIAIGANFTDEGWGDHAAGLSGADSRLLAVSALLIAIAIVLFWIGMHRISHPPNARRD